MNFWFTSDLHLGHTNIIEYCNRPFKDVAEMDETIIQNWNTLVKNEDTVYILGDFSFSNDPNKYFTRLKGNKCLILGNHDSKETKRLNWNLVKDVYMFKQRPICEIWLSHYAHRVWPKAHHDVIHLYGHSHGGLQPFGKSFDVGVDSWNYSPISLEQVLEYTKNLETIKHH